MPPAIPSRITHSYAVQQFNLTVDTVLGYAPVSYDLVKVHLMTGIELDRQQN